MLSDIAKMFCIRLLLFSILLYNAEAWYYDDYSNLSANATIPPIDDIDATPTTTAETDTINTNWTLTSNTTSTVERPKDNETFPDNKVKVEAYPDWYNQPKHSDTTTTESSYDGYNEPETKPEKSYDNNNDYGYLTIENGYLTAHFPETSNKTVMNSGDVEQSKRFYDTTDDLNSTTTDNPDNWPDWFNERDHSVTTTTKRPYYSSWYFNRINATVPPRSTTRHYPFRGGSHYHVHNNTYHTTYITRNSGNITTRRPYWWHTNSTTRPYHYIRPTTGRPFWRNITTSTRRPYWWETTTSTRQPYWWETTTSTRQPYWWETTTSTRQPYWWETTTSTRQPYWWETLANTTTMTERANTTYWPNYRTYNRTNNWTSASYGPTTDYPYYIRSTSPPSFDQSTFPNITNATNIYGAVADFLRKLTRTILPSGVKIIPNSNNNNVALANGNANTIYYSYYYF